MEKITVYQCDYCPKYGKSQSHIKEHEKNCYHNPENKACASCAFLRQKPYEDHLDDGRSYTAYLPECEKKIPIAMLDGKKKILNLKSLCRDWEHKSSDFEEFDE